MKLKQAGRATMRTPSLTFSIAFFLIALATCFYVLRASTDPFRRGVYLASREDMSALRRLLADLPTAEGKNFVGVVGGLAFLNFIEVLQPRTIELLDINPAQVAFGRCSIGLIQRGPNRNHFISSFFSRPFHGQNDADFLVQPSEPSLLQTTLNSLDPETRKACSPYLERVAAARYLPSKQALHIEQNSSGKYLKLRGPMEGVGNGNNLLFYGQGWLRSEVSYQKVRAALASAKIRMTASDIADYTPIHTDTDAIYLWASNLADFYEPAPRAYRKFVGRVHEIAAKKNTRVRVVYLSTYQPVRWTDILPFEQLAKGAHADSSAKVKRRVAGKSVLEIVPGPHGFKKELGAKAHTTNAAEPFPTEAFDFKLLHILAGSTFLWWKRNKSTEYREILRQALTTPGKTLILEHNPQSQDFPTPPAHFVSLETLVDLILELSGKRSFHLEVEHATGEKDHFRNTLVTVNPQS